MFGHNGDRIFGLDLLRAIAVVLVVHSHADDLLDAYWPMDPGAAALDGVTVFFVLSGYLIGNILLKLTAMSAVPWSRRLLDFWQRRWLRTLPNYYLFLLVNVALVAGHWSPGILNINTLAYVVFLQNFIIPLDLFFWESWSLAVEEWFYLLFPLMLALGVGWLRLPWRPGYMIIALLFVAVPTVLRIPASAAVENAFMLDLLVRKIVVMRLDSIACGALMAWCMARWPAEGMRHRHMLLLLGSALLAFTVPWSLRGDLVYNGTWHCTLSACSIALMLPFLSQWRNFRWSAPITVLSLVSYALYLTHMPLRNFFLLWVKGQDLPTTVMLYVGYYLASIAAAAVVYAFWERPFMALRERLTPRILRSNKTAADPG